MNTTSSITLEEVLARLPGYKRAKSGYIARCPAHDDRNPSLSVDFQDGKLLLKCHAGCTYEAVLSSLGLDRSVTSNQPMKIVETYPYVDEDGRLLFEVVRLEPKSFRQRRKTSEGTLKYSVEGVRKVLFRLPKVVKAVSKGEIIYLCEGEKDVLTLEKNSLVATSNPMGAGKWDPGYSKSLAGANIIAVIDRDEAGTKHAALLKSELQSVAKSLKFVQAKSGKDATDHFAAGHKVEDFEQFVFPLREVQSRLGLMSLAELYDMPDIEFDWIIEDMMPTGSFTVLIAKPKVGKSTIVREMIRAILSGEDFLGRKVQQGSIFYFALEERQRSVKEFFQSLGVPGISPLHIAWTKEVCPDLDTLRSFIDLHRPILIVIDTLIRFFEIKDLNDYAEVSRKLSPAVELCREMGVGILATHHSRKGEGDDTGDSALGSTAIFGTVDTLLRLRKDHVGIRKLNSEQRYGEPLEETIIEFDKESMRITLGETSQKKRAVDLRSRILEVLGNQVIPLSELSVKIPDNRLNAQIGIMVDDGTLDRTGAGRKGSPYKIWRTRTEFDSVSDSLPL